MKPDSPTSFHFASTVDASYHDQLESLFYFHPGQSRYYDQIVQNVDRYGQPVIREAQGKLDIQLDQTASTQCLFAFYGPRLSAVLLFIVEEITLIVIHIAIEPGIQIRVHDASLNIMLRLIEQAIKRCENPAIQFVEISYKKIQLPVTVFKTHAS